MSSRAVREPTDDSENQETEVQAGETVEEIVDEKPVTTFPVTIGDRTFNSAEELKSWSDELAELSRTAKAAVKGTKVEKAPTPRKMISEAVSSVLNEHMTDELREALEKLTEDAGVRVIYNVDSNTFSAPVTAKRAAGSGTGGGVGQKMTVDGREFSSAKLARDTLYPDMKEKSQNRETIKKFLEGKEHKVE